MTTAPSSSSPGIVRSELRVSRLRLDHGGFYRCVASNAAGSDVRVMRVDVRGPPYVRPMEARGAVAQQNLVMQCPYSGYPVKAVTWRKEGTTSL